MKNTREDVIRILKSNANPKNVEGMARFGINSKNTLGISVPYLRALAKKIGKDHKLSQELWDSKIHEAKMLASMIEDFRLVSEKQMDSWIKDFDSWDVCDQVCMNLFDKTDIAYEKAAEWAKRKNEFEKRAGFSMMASLACHDKAAPDSKFKTFFQLIKSESLDERNFVKKAVNWALRQIGKRNHGLRKEAIKTAKDILKIDSKSARWIANDAIRELEKKKI